jgi:hypothetical protein
MGGGIRRNCGKCYSSNYNADLQRCNDCGWVPSKDQKTLVVDPFKKLGGDLSG